MAPKRNSAGSGTVTAAFLRGRLTPSQMYSDSQWMGGSFPRTEGIEV